MADNRELILSRLMVISQDISGIVTVARNRGLLRTEKRPAIIIADGDESVSLNSPKTNRPGMTPTINSMRPEIYVILNEQPTTNKEDNEIGQQLNAFRMTLVSKIASDAELKTLLGSNGGVSYNGCVTDLKSGSPFMGQMRIDFRFNYVFDPLA
jgi:hypothetical protein